MASRRGIRRKLRPKLVSKQEDPLRWTGSRYDPDLEIKEINKRIRQFLKTEYPGCKFSVRAEGYRWIEVTVKKVDFRVINPAYVQWRVENDDTKPSPPEYTPRASNMLKKSNDYVESYNHWYRYDGWDHRNYHFDFSRTNFDYETPDRIEYRQSVEICKELGLPTDVFDAEQEEHLRILRIYGKI